MMFLTFMERSATNFFLKIWFLTVQKRIYCEVWRRNGGAREEGARGKFFDEKNAVFPGATACFSTNFYSFSLNAVRAPQLKASVRLLK
jgi:hypothetical protein